MTVNDIFDLRRNALDYNGSPFLPHEVVFQTKKSVGKLTVRAFQRFSNFEKRIQRPAVVIHVRLIKTNG